jgi:hypothetical protein
MERFWLAGLSYSACLLRIVGVSHGTWLLLSLRHVALQDTLLK